MNLLELCREELEKYRNEKRKLAEVELNSASADTRDRGRTTRHDAQYLDLLISQIDEAIERKGMNR